MRGKKLKMSKIKKLNFNKNVFLLGASSDIGIEIMNLYIKNNYKILAHYNHGNKKFFNFLKKK